MNGAEILALHLGKYYKVDSGLRLDSGSIVKALEYATDKEAIVVGKPSIKFFKVALEVTTSLSQKLSCIPVSVHSPKFIVLFVVSATFSYD